MKNQKNKSLPLNSYLKSNGGSKKDKEIKKYKRRSRGLLILLIILGAVLLIQVGQNIMQNWNKSTNSVVMKTYINDTFNNETNGTNVVCKEPTITSGIIKVLETFMDKIFSYPGSFWTKFFIFLGIIYLIQVIFSLAFDVIELILLVFVAIKRLVVWIYRKITGRSKRDEQLTKIVEL